MGECPDWYQTIRASRYLKVPPWELIQRPVMWTAWALEAERREIQAQVEQQKRANRRKPPPRRR